MSQKIIDRFDKQNHYLSNFYNAPVIYKGVKFLNNEAAFQAQKCLSRIEEFTNLQPNKAKSLGRKVNLRNDWDDVKDFHMYGIVKAKFEQNSDIAKRLLNTNTAKLIEGNYWNDTYWGVCKGVGQNKLGHILMKVREEIK